MRQLIKARPHLEPNLAILLSVGLWTMLWLSVSPGNPTGILHPSNPAVFVQGVRAAFPLIATVAAAIIIAVKVAQKSPPRFAFFGPLGLLAVYGLVGLAASINSPDLSVALWWTALYLAVPVVLWGAAWGTRSLDQIGRLVNQTWLIMILASIILFVVALLYLDLFDKLLHPAQLLRCQDAQWVDLTSGRLRSTGVGRYAAIAGLIAISGIWRGRWRAVWLAVLLTSLTLLLYTTARGSFGGFGVGASLMLVIYLFYAGQRLMLSALVAIVVLVPLAWSTGISREFVQNCVFHGFAPSSVLELGVESLPKSSVEPLPKSSDVPGPVATQESGGSEAIEKQPTDQGEGSGSDLPIPEKPDFFTFSGRSAVWVESLELFKESPLIGFGFHADRLLLGTHMHNSVLHALLQAGVIGVIPFVAAVIFGWALLFRIVLKLTLLPARHRHMVIQCGGVLAFLTARSFPESTGAFFGIDWLILALVLFYLQVVNHGRQTMEVDVDRRVF